MKKNSPPELKEKTSQMKQMLPDAKTKGGPRKINDLRGEINFMMEKLEIVPHQQESIFDLEQRKIGKKDNLLNQTLDEVCF